LACITHVTKFTGAAERKYLVLYNGVAYNACFDCSGMDLLEMVHGFAGFKEGKWRVFSYWG
jgi:hypothetical protein